MEQNLKVNYLFIINILDYNTLSDSVLHCMYMIFGDFSDYKDFMSLYPNLTSIIMILFGFVVNIFLSFNFNFLLVLFDVQ